MEYSEKVKSEISLNTIAKPFMTEAAERTGEFINLGILCEDTVVTILNVNGERSALVSRLIPVCPLHCSSMGKIFLSSQTEEEIKEYFRKHFQKRTQYTIATYNEFIQEKDKIVSSGVSYDNEEYEYGLGCIAAPLYSCEDKIIGAISVSGPLSRMKIKGMDSIENCIREAANQINEKLKLAHISTM
ncbi:IclR family transcriptional regulator [Aminipila terrae]